MKSKSNNLFLKGVKDGLPICFGYIPIAFTFGMLAVKSGLPWWIPVIISMTNLTSAGQFAGLSLITTGIFTGTVYVEIAVTTFVINIRYMLMSLAISQRVDPLMNMLERFAVAFGITDEVFAVAAGQSGILKTSYLLGLISMPFVGWTGGTLLGATATGLLPASIQAALGIAIYGMFIAIFVPPAKKARPILITCIIAVVISSIFKWTPILSSLSVGWVIIIAAVIGAGFCAIRYPVHEHPADSSMRLEAEERA